MYVPYIFRQFQGFKLKDIKEFRKKQHMELHLTATPERISLCRCCGLKLGSKRGEHIQRAKHLKCMGWTVTLVIPVSKRECLKCKKVRSELIEFLCPATPHITMDLAWWINQFTEVSAALSVARLESVNKNTCYRVDKYILQRMLQGFEIPNLRTIGVDEVHARSKKQLTRGETREDEFLTVIVDLQTHKVIWVGKSRRKEALDQFFELLGKEACERIKVVATDQHEGYGASVRQYCENACVVWDRFHLIQNFNEALNGKSSTCHALGL